MAVILFKLRGVCEDEADDIRELLTNHKIHYYETSAGNWNISMQAIWLEDDSQLTTARTLINDYQQERYHDAHDEYEQLKRQGEHNTLLDLIRISPLRFFSYLVAIAFVIGLTLLPFLSI